jgi:hypothetical protein
MMREMGCVRLLMAGIFVLVLGCASNRPPATQPSTAEKKEEKKSDPHPEPRNETLNVELLNEMGDVSHPVRGFFRPEPSKKPPGSLLDAIRPLLPNPPIPTLITLMETVPFDGTFPGGEDNYDRWDHGVRDLVRQNIGKAVQYEVVSEPDKKERFKGEKQDFFRLYYHTARVIREVDPKAIIVGPSTSKHDGGWVFDFLKIGKENNVLPNIVTWHEPSPRTDLPGHVGGTGENFWQDGSPVDSMRASQGDDLDRRNTPANAIFFATDIEKAHRENAWRRLHIRFGFKLSHIADNDGHPRSNYFAYKAYAELKGKLVKVNGSSTVDGLATWDREKHSGTIILARDRARQGEVKPETPPLGEVTLEIKQIKSRRLHVEVSRLGNSGDGSSEPPAEVFSGNYVVNGEQVRLGLTNFDDGTVYLLAISEIREPEED